MIDRYYSQLQIAICSLLTRKQTAYGYYKLSISYFNSLIMSDPPVNYNRFCRRVSHVLKSIKQAGGSVVNNNMTFTVTMNSKCIYYPLPYTSIWVSAGKGEGSSAFISLLSVSQLIFFLSISIICGLILFSSF